MFDPKKLKHFSILLKRLAEPNDYNILEINQSIEDLRFYFIEASKGTEEENYFNSIDYSSILKEEYEAFQNKINGLLNKS